MLGVSVLLMELGSYAAIAVLNRVMSDPIVPRGVQLDRLQTELAGIISSPESRDHLHATRGWSYRAGWLGTVGSGRDTINADAIRANREYERTPPADAGLRVAGFGDSFVYCTEVRNSYCWSHVLERDWHAEALNFGVGGYGTDQAFIRYLEDGPGFSPDVVLIGFAPVGLRRIVNRYRRFLSQSAGSWFKPRFQLRDGELHLIPTPVPGPEKARELIDDPMLVTEFGATDHFYEPLVYGTKLHDLSATYRLLTATWIRVRQRHLDPDRILVDDVFNPESEAFELQKAILLNFADSVSAHGSRPYFLFFPSEADVERRRLGEDPSYAQLQADVRASGVPIIDPLELLAGAGDTDLFAPFGHYTRVGNEILAGEIARVLELPQR